MHTELRSPVRNPLDSHYYPLTQTAPQNEYINIISSVNKCSRLELMSSFVSKTLNFKHVKRPSLLSDSDT